MPSLDIQNHPSFDLTAHKPLEFGRLLPLRKYRQLSMPYNHGKVAFSYDHEWMNHGFSISPFSLPLDPKVFIPDNYHFNGLFGIFADSLPDAWGQLLLDRTLKEHGIQNDITILDRLALVGKSGMEL